jgi:hypothetical protein
MNTNKSRKSNSVLIRVHSSAFVDKSFFFSAPLRLCGKKHCQENKKSRGINEGRREEEKCEENNKWRFTIACSLGVSPMVLSDKHGRDARATGSAKNPDPFSSLYFSASRQAQATDQQSPKSGGGATTVRRDLCF